MNQLPYSAHKWPRNRLEAVLLPPESKVTLTIDPAGIERGQSLPEWAFSALFRQNACTVSDSCRRPESDAELGDPFSPVGPGGSFPVLGMF
jgi:hypothetical protein